MSNILILEDEGVIRDALTRLLTRNNYSVSSAASLDEAEQHFILDDFDLIIADLRLPGRPGTDAIALAGNTPVLIMTSYASVRSAVESMKMGAVDYIAKPFDHDEMLLLVKRILKQSALQRQNAALQSEVRSRYPVDGMIGESARMREIKDNIQKVAPTDASVLILGESGTGKELVARALHAHSPRRDGPFIPVNCASIPESLIEAELFGHEKGAFTGATDRRKGLVEAADGGTLFLDEIGELPLSAQAQLLRVLQEGEIRRVGSAYYRHVNIRLIAATNRNLAQWVSDQRFREDLYFRLSVIEISLPPLRKRREDINDLAHYLLEQTCQRLNKPQCVFAEDSLSVLQSYRWPGNVRELENAIERAVILTDDGRITPALLAVDPTQTDPDGTSYTDSMLSIDDYFVFFVREHEKEMTETELARNLGISRKTLWERRQKLGVPRRRQ